MFRVVQGPSLTNIGILPLNLLICDIEYVLNKYFNRQYAFLNIYFRIFFGAKLAFGLTVTYSSQNQTPVLIVFNYVNKIIHFLFLIQCNQTNNIKSNINKLIHLRL